MAKIPFKEINFENIEPKHLAIYFIPSKGHEITVWKLPVGEANNEIIFTSETLPESLNWAIRHYVEDCMLGD